jgi:hypothetical protein
MPAQSATFPAWRGSPEATVAHFAVAVLGWQHPVVRSAHSPFAVGPGVRVFAVRRTPTSPSIEVRASALVNTSIWSVVSVWGFGKSDHPASVTVTSDRANISFDYWAPATSAELRLQYGPHLISKTSRHAAKWSVPITFTLTSPGAVMILFRDGAGVVFTAWGTPLAAGESSAG